jgi:hypothetical protein
MAPHHSALVRLCFLALMIACGPRAVRDVSSSRYAGIATPSCDSDRPIARAGVGRAYSCWRLGSSADRTLSASCRIDEKGNLACWRRSLERPPAGQFAMVDDDGENACAVSEAGKISCWGGRRGWARIPVESYFATVSVGRGASPRHLGRSYACGLTLDGFVWCWEDGNDGELFSLQGRFLQMEAGNNTVCGVSTNHRVTCLASATNASVLRITGEVAGLSLGEDGTRCTLNSKTAWCWETHTKSMDDADILDDVMLIRAGDRHACALLVGGRISCLGDAPPPPTLNFRYLSRPDATSTYCGIGVDGQSYCWGDRSPSLL